MSGGRVGNTRQGTSAEDEREGARLCVCAVAGKGVARVLGHVRVRTTEGVQKFGKTFRGITQDILPEEKKHWLGWSCLRYCVCVFHLSCVYPGGRSKASFVCVESQQHTLSFFGMGLEVWLPGRGEARRHRSPYRRRLTVVSFHIASPGLDEWRAAVNSQSPTPAARIKPSADRRRRIPTSESMSMSSSNTRHSMDVVDTCRRACASRV